MSEYISALAVDGATDSKRIQAAIREAKQTGKNKVIIPKKETPWVIDETVSIPSDMEIFIDGAHLILADGTFVNMFATENYLNREIRPQSNIEIHGANGAVLDGGEYNGLSEANCLKDGRPHIIVNTTMLFYYTENLRVHNLRIVNQRYWGITNIFVSNSSYRNIEFQADFSRMDENGIHHPDQVPKKYKEVYVKNADGIDLRVGCHHVVIENITGFTGDDTVALTALGGFEKPLFPKGVSGDIHDVTIKNIKSDSYVCSQLRLLCGRGHKLYNITADGITDTTDTDLYRTNATVRIGDIVYGEPSGRGDMHHICVRNVITRGTSAVSICRPLSDSVFENIENVNVPFSAVQIRHGAELNNVVFTDLKNSTGV